MKIGLGKYKRAYRQVEKHFGNYDGFYELKHRAIAAFSAIEKSRSCSVNSPLFLFLARCFDKYGTGLSLSSLRELLRLEVKKQSFQDDELCLYYDAITLLILPAIANPGDEGRREKAFTESLELLFSIKKDKFDDFFAEFSQVHRILTDKDVLCYPACDPESKGAIRQTVYRLSRKHRISEKEAAMLFAKDPEKYLRPDNPQIFFLLWGGIFVLLLLPSLFGLWALGLRAPLLFLLSGLCLLLPLSESARFLAEWILGQRLHPRPILKKKPGRLPKEGTTLTVITTLLPKAGDNELFSRLETMWRQNRAMGDASVLRFGLLLDFRDSENYRSAEDEQNIEFVQKELEKLNRRCGNAFCLFLRERRKNRGEKGFAGWERKRGALLELCRLLRGKSHSFTLVALGEDPDFLSRVRYIITLDADTNLSIGAVGDLVFPMLHPVNRPVVENGRVVKGYGILQPRMIPSLESAGASPFSVMISGCGGTELYQRACFDLYGSLFDRGIYCGKGVFDVDSYLEVLDGAFPEGCILSHDLLEGARLRCGALSELTLTDSCPKTPLSYFQRQHRWLRGDLQALPFAFPTVRNEQGEKQKNPAEPICRFMILDNLRRELLPVIGLSNLLFSLLLPRRPSALLLLLTFSYLVFPVIRALLSFPGNLLRRFYSNVLEGCWHTLGRSLYSLSSLVHEAILTIDAFSRSLYRMTVSRKNLLQWVTAADSEKRKGGLAVYYRSMFPSLLLGLLLFLLSSYPLQRLLGLGFFICPFLSHLLSKPYPKKRQLSPGKMALLKRWSEDAFRFYCRFVTEEDHYLPPDNYQELPVEAIAHRTSPTNIAMYLLSLLAAVDFGFLSPKELQIRLSQTVNTLEKLPKHRGLFYNWYDTRTLEVLGTPYLSTVDCGNLAAALVAVREGLSDFVSQEPALIPLQEDLQRLENSMELGILYDSEKKLFAIGMDAATQKRSEGCYDLLMSEARTTSYYAIAKGIVPKEHWAKLARPLLCREGHIGLASWSGTAFEYFMPPLLLPICTGSLLYEAMGFALFEQAEEDEAPFWGRSESGYFAFDADMNYQYRAFGVPFLALESGQERHRVFAPYAAFLALCTSISMPIQNLQKMEQFGLYGQYGFYEAVDLTKSRVGDGHAIIRSYMAHHTGMILAACDNACFGGILQRRFLRDPDMAAAMELLCEKIPVDAPIHPLGKRKVPLLHRPLGNTEGSEEELLPLQNAPGSHTVSILAGDALHLLADTAGNLSLSARRLALTYPFGGGDATVESLRTLRLLIQVEDRESREGHSACLDLLRDPRVHPMQSDGALCYRLEYATKDGEAQRFSAEFVPEPELPFLQIHIRATGSFTHVTPLLALEPILSDPKAYLAHPAFRALSLESEYLSREGILLFRKRPREPGETPLYLALSLGSSMEFLTRRDEAFPLQYREGDLRALLKRDFSCATGACVQPFCAIKKTSRTKGGRYEATILLGSGTDREALLSSLHALRKKSQGKRRSVQGRFGATADSAGYESLLLTGLLKDSGLRSRGNAASMDALWRYGISGDLPLAVLRITGLSRGGKKILEGLLLAHKLLLFKGFPLDLVLLYREIDHYFAPMKHALEELVIQGGSRERLSRKGGGVFLLPDSEECCSVLSLHASIFETLREDDLFETLRYRILTCDRENTSETTPEAEVRPLLPAPRIQHGTPILTRPAGEDGKLIRFFEGETVIEKGDLMAPWSYLYAIRSFGTLLTADSLGYTWFGNAALFRLTKWSCDPLLDLRGERLLLESSGRCIDLAAVAGEVAFGDDAAVYRGEDPSLGLRYTLRAGIDGKFPVKVVCLELESLAKASLAIDLTYLLRADLGGRAVIRSEDGDAVFYRGIVSGASDFGLFLLPEKRSLSLHPGETTSVCFLLGCMRFRHDRGFYRMREMFGDVTAAGEAYRRYTERFCSHRTTVFHLKKALPEIEVLFNRALPYQIKAARIFGRSGFYQSGGAYGFRDQLQDCLGLLESEPSLLRDQLLRCACHQYLSGDVQHWWHPTATKAGESEPGIRSLCADDLLFLPYCLAEYLAVTGDDSLLSLSVAYLDSPPLQNGERERYEKPKRTLRKESLYTHAMRAIDCALSRKGIHGLPLFGSGDWNDGMSHVGAKGKGESLATGQFLLLTILKFLPLARKYGSKEDVSRLEREIPLLKEAIAKGFCTETDDGMEHGYFLRGYFDCGLPLGAGDRGSKDCRIDLIPQAFAGILCGEFPQVFQKNEQEMAQMALESAYDRLYREDLGTWQLLSPPFDKGEPFPGYIRGYCPGVRENGGQYTHGALFAVYALFLLGDTEKATEILYRMLPTVCAENPRYRGEPYATAADICLAPGLEGRAGWTQYTGSAGWMYRLLLRGWLGYREEDGNAFRLSPVLTKRLSSFLLEVRRGDTLYRIEVTSSNGEQRCYLDQKEVSPTQSFPFDGKEHQLLLLLPRKIEKEL